MIKTGISWDILLSNEYDFKVKLSNNDPRKSVKEDFNNSLEKFNEKINDLVNEQTDKLKDGYTKYEQLRDRGNLIYKEGHYIKDLDDWNDSNPISKTLIWIKNQKKFITKAELYEFIGIRTKHLHPKYFDPYSVKTKLSYTLESKNVELNLLRMSNIKLRNLTETTGKIKTLDIDNLQVSLLTPQNFKKKYEDYASDIYNGLASIACLNAYIIFNNKINGTSEPLLEIDLDKKENNLRLLIQPNIKKIIDLQKEFLGKIQNGRRNETIIFNEVIRQNKEIYKSYDQFKKKLLG